MSKRSFTTSQEAEVLARYEAGESIYDLAHAFDVSVTPVCRALKNAGVTSRQALLEKDIQAKSDEIAEACRAGMSIAGAARKYGFSKKTIGDLVCARGVQMPLGCPPTRTVDHAAFDVVTPESAYWLGFLFADGTVGKEEGKSPHVGMGLSVEDREHVEKFRDFLKSDHAISVVMKKTGFGGGPTAYFRVRSKQLAAAVIARGMCHIKADRTPTPDVADSRDFWRGMVDGDGSVGRRHKQKDYPLISLGGQFVVVKGFIDFLRQSGVRTKVQPAVHDSIFCAELAGPGLAVKAIRLLYKNASVALDRKLLQAQEILADRRYATQDC